MRWVIGTVCVWMACSAAAQQYELVDPNDRVAGSISVTRGRLTVNEPAGQTVVFLREDRYDSADADYYGFVNSEIGRVLRFPRSGRGKLQVADLREPSPRFRFTQRSVRPQARPTAPLLPNRNPVEPPPEFDPGRIGVDRFDGNGFGGAIGIPPYGAPAFSPYAAGYPYPQSVLLDSKIIPDRPLPASSVELFNSSRREVQVGIIDLKSGGNSSFRLQPGASKVMEFRRDVGGTRVDQYQTFNAFGESVTREVTRRIRPTVRYEIVVHEWQMQSIAIDRTGKSPNAIEDVKFQGKGMGRFRLPAGNALRDGRIDVVRAALSGRNAGTVTPILAREDPATDVSPLERAVLELQR